MIIKVVDKAGQRQIVETGDAQVLMQALRNIPNGTQAACGGMMACATCHVYIADEWLDRVPPPDDEEASMLEVLNHVTQQSRLSCQIPVSEALDGIALTIAQDE